MRRSRFMLGGAAAVTLVTAVWASPGASPTAGAGARPAPADDHPRGHQRGIPENAPWLSFYGTARQMGDLRRVAAAFRLINIDADPAIGNFTRADIAVLRAGGRN